MKPDWRLIILLVLAIVFASSAMQPQPSQPVCIEGNFIAFDTGKVFNISTFEDDCQEPSYIDKMPAF